MKPVTLVVAGAGGRGAIYASFAKHFPERARVVGVAEPREVLRQRMIETHGIPAGGVFASWEELAAKPRMADAVIVATQDAMHEAPTVALAAKGYHILLEKPMAPTEAACQRIVNAVRKAGVIFAVCHVMRYTQYTRMLKRELDSGRIGEIVSIQHLEPVGYWHQAHSFVRGNWRNEAESSFMLLAKSCHDMDWLRYIMGRRCVSVSSFGALTHFRPECRPAGAADRCLDCGVEAQCPYSAKRIYLGRFEKGQTAWPVANLAPVITRESLMEALRNGPYGRCVYACDNDVVDHQVVNILFEGARTASFTMTGLTESTGRRTRIFGTRGEINAQGGQIRVYDFLTDTAEMIDTTKDDGSVLTGHGGGDAGVMDCFVRAVAENNPSHIISGPDETLESHRMVFAAEKARRENRVVNL